MNRKLCTKFTDDFLGQFVFEFCSIVCEYFDTSSKTAINVVHICFRDFFCCLRLQRYTPCEPCKHTNSCQGITVSTTSGGWNSPIRSIQMKSMGCSDGLKIFLLNFMFSSLCNLHVAQVLQCFLMSSFIPFQKKTRLIAA